MSLSQMMMNELPLNRKERFYTGTVLPMIVCRDANVERAANGCVWGSLTNSGQVCISIERVYVDQRIYDDFVGRVIEKVGKLR